ncbi:nucleoside/nucleotide kinase family protein [Sedimentitalea sp. CY04]|uniref:Nucleoside/nucleotide kinase family protein n=1 Tax=Parasedimentitalea denitrificans TaxID=2211118 RepID=A0ABX0W7B8_9RHOB|nr:nucleoside/nucleotide kinase family protein [Sedimentitalea sp. CY04]NIZ60195.1 nucleoside/nucleotide kinase family protein [Sedimentitalea sp. CY04]
MSSINPSIEDLAEQVLASPRSGVRRLVALAGSPASGKSTQAEILVNRLNEKGCSAQVLPMDGFHLHNEILVERGLLNSKGAPETFDMHGFLQLITRLHDEPEVYFPTFDRSRDIAIAAAGCVNKACDTVIVEGNYLLFDKPGWRDLRHHWDLALRLEVPGVTLKRRLIERWLSYGLSPEQARRRAEENDLANAKLIDSFALHADIII